MIKGIKRSVIVLMLAAGVIFMAGAGISIGEVRMAVVPFEVEHGQEKEIIQCRACGNVFGAGPVEGDPSSLLTGILWDLLQEKSKGFDFINPDQVEGFYNVLLSKEIEKDPLKLMKNLGLQMKADYVLWGHIFRYQERVGTTYAVQYPASVAFDLHLMKVKDGQMVWKAHWDQTQKSLSENILKLDAFLKSKMRWITASELSRQGLKEMLKDFPPVESLR